jgi:hypothetical protein
LGKTLAAPACQRPERQGHGYSCDYGAKCGPLPFLTQHPANSTQQAGGQPHCKLPKLLALLRMNISNHNDMSLVTACQYHPANRKLLAIINQSSVVNQ